MKVISIKDPWATLIARGVKDVENRTWSTTHRGPLLIHTSLQYDRNAHADKVAAAAMVDDDRVRRLRPADMPRGMIIGVATIHDVHHSLGARTCYNSPDGPCSLWGQYGAWHFMLSDMRRLETPVPWRGSLGIRSTPFDIHGDWLVEMTEGCTCAGDTQYGHEPGCGLEPLSKLISA